MRETGGKKDQKKKKKRRSVELGRNFNFCEHRLSLSWREHWELWRERKVASKLGKTVNLVASSHLVGSNSTGMV